MDACAAPQAPVLAPQGGVHLVGRDPECRWIEDVVTGAGGSGALILGEAGSGKSALLDLAEQYAVTNGSRVLRARGVEREAQRTSRCRERLEEALTAFDRLVARPWSARTRAELTASGARTRCGPPGPAASVIADLSPQELQVARAACRGLNNAEVAETLFVSRKTVESHLTRIYRKLGVRSRTELTRLFVAHGVTD